MMVTATNLQQFSPLVSAAIGHFIYRLIMVVIAAIPTWIIVTSIKDWFSLKMKRDALIKSGFLATDIYYEISGKRGFLKVIGSRWLKLEDVDHTTHNIPIEDALEGPISKINFKEPITESAPEPEKVAEEEKKP